MIKTFFKHNGLKRLGLFSFLSLGLFVQSCTKELEGLGGDLVPSSDLVQAMETDTFSIQTKMVWVDSVRTDRNGANGSVLIGSYEDERFGRTSCAALFQMDRVTSSDVIPADWSVLRVELDLAVQSGLYVYGDVKEMQYSVQQLTERMSVDSNYYAMSQVEYDPTDLMLRQDPQASSALIAEDGGSKNILRLQLNEDLGAYLLGAGTTVLNDKDAFRNYFKGLRISTTTTAGRVMRYDLGSSNTRLRVYYSTPFDPEAPNGRRVEQYLDFGISTTSGTLGHTEFFTQIDRSLYGTSLMGIDAAGEMDANERIMMQNGHLVFELDYSSLTQFLRQNTVLVHNVDLVMPVLDTKSKERRRPFYMVSLKELENVQSFYSAEAAFFRVVNAFAYRSDQGAYRLDVTSFIRQNQEDEDLSSTFFVLASNSALAVSQVELAGPSYDPNDAKRNMRLVVTYSDRIEN
jgi:hypothetical protein